VANTERPNPVAAKVQNVADVKSWWAENPMTYGEVHGRDEFADGKFERLDRAYFERLDQEFYSWNTPLHGHVPFSKIFPYGKYSDGAKVLEIGCGLGTMSMNWRKQGADIHSLDLNPTSVTRTRMRFQIMDLAPAKAIQGDGRFLPFPDATFDYAYSWGVLHHSPDLDGSLQEMLRVIKPGGGFGLMLYNRQSFLHWYQTEYLQGFVHRESKFLNPVQLASRYGDGGDQEGNPHTWPVTRDELRIMLGPRSPDLDFKILGTDIDHSLDMFLLALGRRLPRFLKKPWARRYGWSIWAHGHKS
jgi:SAM-dependent methyltransferase